jgi:regulatory protein
VLRRKGVEDDVADEVLGRFQDVGLIDDALFAQMWVTSRHRGRGLARRALSQELRRKGVDDSSIAEAVATLDGDQELETARALVERKLRTTVGLPTEARVRRLAGLLARKGYPAGLAFSVVKQALTDERQHQEEEGRRAEHGHVVLMPSARSRPEVADLRRADTTAHSDRELEELLILDDVQASDDDQ